MVATNTVTLPLRLATIHNGEQRVVEMLSQRYGNLDLGPLGPLLPR